MTTDQRYSSLLLLSVYSSVLAFLVPSSSSFLFQFVPLLVVFPARPRPSVFLFFSSTGSVLSFSCFSSTSLPSLWPSLAYKAREWPFFTCSCLTIVRHERLCFFEKKQGQKTCSPLCSFCSCILLCSRCSFLSGSRETETWWRTGGLVAFFLRCSWPPLFLWEETRGTKVCPFSSSSPSSSPCFVSPRLSFVFFFRISSVFWVFCFVFALVLPFFPWKLRTTMCFYHSIFIFKIIPIFEIILIFKIMIVIRFQIWFLIKFKLQKKEWVWLKLGFSQAKGLWYYKYRSQGMKNEGEGETIREKP